MTETNGHMNHPLVRAAWLRDGRTRKVVPLDDAASEVASVLRIDVATIRQMLAAGERVETGWSVWQRD
ncbi:MAG TPA: hypothetical protein VEA69_00205 [Tepidisphaeraceae bacterium]|nr:hypothetical protein [Tepidisphaeraceae bacterium]